MFAIYDTSYFNRIILFKILTYFMYKTTKIGIYIKSTPVSCMKQNSILLKIVYSNKNIINHARNLW